METMTIVAYAAGVVTLPLVVAGCVAAYCLGQKVRAHIREREARRGAREVYERLDAGCGIASIAEERREVNDYGEFHPRVSEVLPGEAWWCDSSRVGLFVGWEMPRYSLPDEPGFFYGELTCRPDGRDQILVGRTRGGELFADIGGERLRNPEWLPRAKWIRFSTEHDLVELRDDGDVIWTRGTPAPIRTPPTPPPPESFGAIRRLTEEEMLGLQVDAVLAEAEARWADEGEEA